MTWVAGATLIKLVVSAWTAFSMKLIILLRLFPGAWAVFEHMNGEYHFANQKPGTKAQHRGTGYFDLYTDVIESQYGQVKWDAHNIPLEKDFVSKHDGKVISIVGIEFDIIRKNEAGEDVSVPSWEQYNHHYEPQLLGKSSKIIMTNIPSLHGGGCANYNHKGSDHRLVYTGTGNPAWAAQFLPMGNGAESRKTFKFFPPGYGAFIESPAVFSIRPMIIDTKNRNSTSTRHGPVPASSNVGPEAMYSGLIECPCTDKYPKQISNFATQNHGVCSKHVTTAESCFAAAAELGLKPVKANLTESSTAHPAGCHVSAVNGGFDVVFNDGKSHVPCGTTKAMTRMVGTMESLVKVAVDVQPDVDTVKIELTGPSDVWFGVGFGATMSDMGESSGYSMAGTPWAIVVADGKVEERKLGYHEPGTLLPVTVTVHSNTVINGHRKLVLTRGIKAGSFNFTSTTSIGMINAVGSSQTFGYHKAKATDVMFLVDVMAPTCICQDSIGQGTIGGFAWGPQRCQKPPLSMMMDDPKWALNDRINPTCLLKSYRGGLRCCLANTILLDSNQTVPSEKDHYQLKFRFYYDELDDNNISKVNDVYGTGWWTEYNNDEHDVPACQPGEDCVYVISSNFTVGDMPGFNPVLGANGTTFIHVEGHCHVGCLKMELWIMDDPANPRLLCGTNVVYGTGEEAHNEMGYILSNEPCIFGLEEDGFEPPVVLHASTKLMSLKYQNNTVARYGDMALWEVEAAYLKSTESEFFV